MKKSIAPLIIIVLIAVIAVVGLIAFRLLSSNGESSGGLMNIGGNSEPIVPTITLTLDSYEENRDKVMITAYASTDDEEGIEEIILPDKSIIRSNVAVYAVEENRDYTFEVVAKNGESAQETITVSNIRDVSATNPYIPDGFSHIGGEVEEGFVIEDENGNQFVWVPVASGKLTRNTMLNTDYEESTTTATALVNSVAQNYGFYIGRFEASEYEKNGEKVAASIGGKIPWTGINFQEATKYANNAASVFGYEGYNTALINSYSWDTVLKWIDETTPSYSSSTNYGNYSGAVYPTGATESDIVNNICDLAGNVREWTTEIYKAYVDSSSKDRSSENNSNILARVVRGGSASLSRTAASHTGYAEDNYDNYWGFRLILYK